MCNKTLLSRRALPLTSVWCGRRGRELAVRERGQTKTTLHARGQQADVAN